MNRPDILSLTEEDLIRSSSVGMVKRAKREFASTSASASIDGDGVVVHWQDGITCRFPPACSVRGICSCPADEICRHLVRSVLFLIQHKDHIADSREKLTPAKEQQPTVDELLSLPENEFQTQIGKQKLQKARRAIKGNVDATVLDATERIISFPRIGVQVRFPPGGSIESALCTCQEPTPCTHILPALLILRGEGTSPLTQDDTVNETLIRNSLTRVRQLLHELLRAGIDGVSLAWCDAVRTTALEIEKEGLVIPAELLTTLSREIESELTGESPFHPHVLRTTLAKLWTRIILSDRESTLPFSGGDLIDRPRAHYWTGGPARLTGVGLRAWQSDRIRGITLFLMEERTREVVSTGTGRPIERNHSTLSLASHAALFGETTALEMLGHVLECSGIRLTDNGKVLPGEGATCQISRDPVSWSEIVDRDAITRWSMLSERLKRDYPSLLSHRRDKLYWFKPTDWNEAVLTINHQSLEWPMIDSDGQTLSLIYTFSNERAHSFKSLKRFASTSTPVALLGILRFQAGQPRVEPVTILYSSGNRVEAYCIDLERPVGR
ncbi:hypothetical protein K2Y11_08790 [bacterium]|nr:hypothetical protein [bacterium]